MKRLLLFSISLLLALSMHAGDGRFFKKLSGQNVPTENIVERFAEWFSLPEATEWREVSRTTDFTGMERIEYRQYVAGVEVEHSQVLIHAKDGMVRSANGTVMEARRAPAKIRQHSPIYKSGTPTDMLGRQLYFVNTPEGYRYAYKVMSADSHEWVYYDADTQQVIKRVATWHRSAPITGQSVKVEAKTIYSGDVTLDASQDQDGSIYLYDEGRNIHTLCAAYLPTISELNEQGKLYSYFPQGDMPDDFYEATPEQLEAWSDMIDEMLNNNELEHFTDYILDNTSLIKDNDNEFKAFRINDFVINNLTVMDEDGNLVPFTPSGGDDDDEWDDGDDDDNWDDGDDDEDWDDDDDGDDDDSPSLYLFVLYGTDTDNLSQAALTQMAVDMGEIGEIPYTIPISDLYQTVPGEGATLVVLQDNAALSAVDTLAVVSFKPNDSGLLEISNDRVSLTLDYEPAGNPVADIHWGMGKTLDFYNEVFGRDSYDGKGSPVYNLVYNLPESENTILGFDACNAAALATQAPYPMLYGLGGFSYTAVMRPIVELSVMAHEFTHIITGQTANLEYMGESGALNESFSDIMGISVKKYATDATDWYIGEGVGLNSMLQPYSNIRDMADPKNSFDGESPSPDTYGGENWADPTDIDDGDEGGIHTNSSVQNKWYFLVTDGGKGTNDNGDNYDVEGIGIEKSRQIAYLTLTSYATAQSDYAAIRQASLEATEVLYGANSKECKTVAQAWDAVGVAGSPDATGIDKLAIADSHIGLVYDLQGRLLNGQPTQRGIYIINGKKHIIK